MRPSMMIQAKADRYKAMQEGMSTKEIPLKWLYGNETDDPLRFGFDSKRVVHPTIKSPLIDSKDIQARWQQVMQTEGYSASKVAYIHIPFCLSHCYYCGFFQNFIDRQLEDAFIDCLIDELTQAGASRFIESGAFDAVYIGGGTPSALKTANLRRLLEAINNYLPMADNCEFTMEASLQTFSEETLKTCKEGRINRISFGVQSFDTSVRRLMGRAIEGKDALARLNSLASKVKDSDLLVIIDLIYGLPLQDRGIWERDVETYIASNIDSADFYQLNVFSDSRLKDLNDSGLMPSPATVGEQALMFARTVDLMDRSAQSRLSITHWARNPKERNLYNSLSKGGAVIVPFGPGAGGRIGGSTIFLKKDIGEYIEDIKSGVKPLMFMTESVGDFTLYYTAIGQLDKGFLDLKPLEGQYQQHCYFIYELVKKWQERGFVQHSEGMISLTIAGQFWHVNLTQSLIDWLQTRIKE